MSTGTIDDRRVDTQAEARQQLILFDDARARNFEPFATSRPLGEMRVGALLVRERWQQCLSAQANGFVGAPHLAHFEEFDAPPAVGDVLPAGAILVNTRAVPFLDAELDASANAWVMDGRLAAVRLTAPLNVVSLQQADASLESLDVSGVSARIDGVWLDEVWDITRHLTALLQSDIPVLAALRECAAVQVDHATARGPVILGDHDVWREVGATVEPFVIFDTTQGPVLLGAGSVVQGFTRVVGPCYIGRNCTVMADRIAGSSIGDTCRVHGELSTTVMIGHANKGHDGFVGHSIIGRWVNLGAGTITSNLKNTYGGVALWTPTGVRDTGLQFLGTLFGDHAKTGIGLRLTTGCVLGVGANVMDHMPPKAVRPFAWGTKVPYDLFSLEKFLVTAERMMQRRHVTLGALQRACLTAAHARAIADDRWPTR